MNSVLALLVVLGLCLGTHGNANITVSGVSSGAAFAVQYHVAFSQSVVGAGLVAGIPYWCANGLEAVAITTCMQYPALISIGELVAVTKAAYIVGNIDSPTYLANAKVYLYSGTLDTVVNPGVVQKLEQYYQSFVTGNITTDYSIASEHAFVTAAWGNDCGFLGSPYINNCDYDTAGKIFNVLFEGALKDPVAQISSNLHTFSQEPFLPTGVTLDFASLGDSAYIYIPTGCASDTSSCDLHVAFHGCEQTISLIGTDFVNNTNYNTWAEANDIMVLYPQVEPNLLNPEGCWDWWGYTGESYATKYGWQMVTVNNMVNNITSGGMIW